MHEQGDLDALIVRRQEVADGARLRLGKRRRTAVAVGARVLRCVAETGVEVAVQVDAVAVDRTGRRPSVLAPHPVLFCVQNWGRRL